MCSGTKQPGGCRSGTTTFLQTMGMNRYNCEMCDFDMCQQCVDGIQGGVAAPATTMQQSPSAAVLTEADYQLLQIKMPKAGLDMTALTHLAQVREERREVEALWEKVSAGRLANQKEWTRLEAYRNSRMSEEHQVAPIGNMGNGAMSQANGDSGSFLEPESTDPIAANNHMERQMLDSQRGRLKKERDELQEDLKVVRGVQKECNAMWEEAEKHLLKVKLTTEMGRRV